MKRRTVLAIASVLILALQGCVTKATFQTNQTRVVYFSESKTEALSHIKLALFESEFSLTSEDAATGTIQAKNASVTKMMIQAEEGVEGAKVTISTVMPPGYMDTGKTLMVDRFIEILKKKAPVMRVE